MPRDSFMQSKRKDFEMRTRSIILTIIICFAVLFILIVPIFYIHVQGGELESTRQTNGQVNGVLVLKKDSSLSAKTLAQCIEYYLTQNSMEPAERISYISLLG